tara:strand:- start:3277 stop:3834 length:558 start_codon:yes stop_codon:yes gene_type:complete
MANRVLLGKLPDGSFGLKVSKKTKDVTSGSIATSDLLFDSRLNRTGQIYAGANNVNFDGTSGNPTETAGINFLTAVSPNKANLGYIPLILRTEKNMGEREDQNQNEYFIDQVSSWETTTTNFIPVDGNADAFSETSPITNFAQPAPSPGRNDTALSSSEEDPINVSYFVLRIPCAFGYMTTSNFG